MAAAAPVARTPDAMRAMSRDMLSSLDFGFGTRDEAESVRTAT
jgi:hypothetical protein